MEVIWFFMAFSSGVVAGFFLFAMLQVSRGSDSKRRILRQPARLSFEFDGDTVSPM